MHYRPAQLIVGFLMACLVTGLTVLSTQLGQVDLIGERGYVVQATFPTAGGLQEGAGVELAGVKIGQVEKVGLVDDRALVTLRIDPAVALQTDVRAAIKAQGLIGERYVEITPGKASSSIPPAGKIVNTEPPIDIEKLLGELFLGGAAPPTPDRKE